MALAGEHPTSPQSSDPEIATLIDAMVLDFPAWIDRDESDVKALNDADYLDAVVRLLYWLPRVETPPVRQWIAKQLSDARAGLVAGPTLIHEYMRSDDATKTVIGRAIAYTIDNSIIDDLTQLCRDPHEAAAHVYFIVALGRTLHPKALAAIVDALANFQLTMTALVVLGQFPPQSVSPVRPRIEKFLVDHRPDVRILAQRLITRLDRAAGQPLPSWPPDERGPQALEAFIALIHSRQFNSVIDGPQPPWLVAEAEAALDVVFPPTYLQFLQQLGHVALFGDPLLGIPAGHTGFVFDVVEITWAKRRHLGLPHHYVPFWAEEDVYSCYLVIDTSLRDNDGESPIRRWYDIDSPPMAELDIVAPDFGAAALMIARKLLADAVEVEVE